MNKNTIVIDASVAIKLIVVENDSRIAIDLFEEWGNQNKLIIAPALFIYEITNTLLKKARRGTMTIAEVKVAASAILETGIEIYWPIDPDLPVNSLDLAYTHNLPAIYDAHYLALAEHEQCEFWTANERLYNTVKNRLSWVRLMADYRPTAISS